MNNTVRLAAALVLISVPALADGNGAVTWYRSQAPTNPNCLIWQTNNGTKNYGVSLFSQDADVTLSQVGFSFVGLCTITFNPRTVIDPDCPNNVVAVEKVDCQ